jgi:tetratricopeptide (TPR) repeat protein
MGLRTTIFTMALTMLLTQLTSGQNFHTRSNRALKYYHQGKRDYEFLYYDRAESNLKLAVEEDNRFYEAQVMLGQLYTDTGDWEKSVTHYRSAVRIDSLYFTPALFSLGRAELRTGRYFDALNHLEAYLKQPGVTPKLRVEAEKMIASCRFALTFPSSLYEMEPVSAGDSVNTVLDEYWP